MASSENTFCANTLIQHGLLAEVWIGPEKR
jgi:hypothetical protein